MSGVAAPEGVWIPPGSFWMGATENDRFASLLEKPRHRVTFARGFWLAKHPVTRDQVEASGLFGPIEHRLPGQPDRGDWPAMGVSRTQAEAYARWMTEESGRRFRFRLPAEAEWEHAARAGTQDPFWTGADLSLAQANYLYDERANRVGPGHPVPVGALAPNPWGLFDMLGSVAEWVADDWHPGYAGAPADGSARRNDKDEAAAADDEAAAAAATAAVGVVRGGAWDLLPRLCRCAHREPLRADARIDNVGFRLAWDEPEA